jgi:hypothetical protein
MKIFVTATIIIERPNDPPVFDENPPVSSRFLIGQPKTIPFGRAHDPDGDPLAIELIPSPQGFTATLAQNGQINLAWNGDGVPGTYLIEMSLDDGKEGSSP